MYKIQQYGAGNCISICRNIWDYKPDSVNVLEWKGIVLDTGENRLKSGTNMERIVVYGYVLLIFIRARNVWKPRE